MCNRLVAVSGVNRCDVKLGVKISQDIVLAGNVDVPSAVPLSGELKDQRSV